MDNELSLLLTDLERCESLDPAQRVATARRAMWLLQASDDQVGQLLEELLNRAAPAADSVTEVLLGSVFQALVRRARDGKSAVPSAVTQERIALLYQHLGVDSKVRHLLLCVLSNGRSQDDLELFTRFMVDDPPTDVMAVGLAFTPLFQHPDYDVSAIFPRLLDGIVQHSVAVAILDLANFLTREKIVTSHPATDRLDQLLSLLGGLVGRLGHMEEQPLDSGDAARESAERVAEALSLAVSLCDALALIGDDKAVGKLYQALELGHRRLRAEAAAALAIFGEKAGRQALIELAAEPIVRLRVLAYAEELGLLEEIDDQYKTPLARAEAELALYLAQPSQLGFPPSEFELVESRTQYWPSYDDPVECFLVRYSYQFGSATYSNIGIIGPLTHAMTADLADLSPDDIYAAYAGWQVEHEEIYEVEIDTQVEVQYSEIARLQRRLRDAGYKVVKLLTLGFFFGDKSLIAVARREGVDGLAVVDAVDMFWYPRRESRRPLEAREVSCIYKGRKLLRKFNA